LASATITVPARRQKSLAELGAQKQTIRRLNESLQLAASNTTEGEVSSEGEDDEDSGVIVPVDGCGRVEDDDDDDYASLKKSKPTRRRHVASLSQTPLQADTQTPLQADTQMAPTVRHRFPTKSAVEQRQELFGASASGAKKVTSTTVAPEFAGTEALLDYQRSEQEAITSDLLSMAKMLKESSLEFGKNLDDEKSYLQAAREGLDRNAQGMQVAGQKMDVLRRDENVSFIWSMIYLAIIVALVSPCDCWLCQPLNLDCC